MRIDLRARTRHLDAYTTGLQVYTTKRADRQPLSGIAIVREGSVQMFYISPVQTVQEINSSVVSVTNKRAFCQVTLRVAYNRENLIDYKDKCQ